MDELTALRGKIDAIDRDIARLFLERMGVTRAVGEYKAAHGLPVLDAQREREVLAAKAALTDDPRSQADLTALFETVMSRSRLDQRRLVSDRDPAYLAYLAQKERSASGPVERPRVLYQGVPGAYAEEAARTAFGDGDHRALPTWEDVFLALQRGEADYGVVPIENSSTGSISQVYDLLARYGACITGEVVLRVRHCLMARPGTRLEEVTTVYSHEQGLFQCAPYLKAHPAWQTAARSNTAAAAQQVARGTAPGEAAIGSERAAQLYGLTVLARNISAAEENYTRFVVVSPRLELSPEGDKVSVLFNLPHRSGTLHQIMGVFAAAGRNLMKLESRPIPGKSWEYLFFLDFTGSLLDPAMDLLIQELTQYATGFRLLGNYKSDDT